MADADSPEAAVTTVFKSSHLKNKAFQNEVFGLLIVIPPFPLIAEYQNFLSLCQNLLEKLLTFITLIWKIPNQDPNTYLSAHFT